MWIFSRSAHDQHRLGMILAFASLMGLGTYNALAKGLTPYLTPVTLLLMSELLTATFVIMTFGLVTLFKEASKMTRGTFGIALLIGLLNSAIAPFLWFKGLQETTAMNASILTTADIIGVLIFGYFLLGERISRMQEIGATVVVVGIVVVNIAAGASSGMTVHKGDIYILVATQISALGTVLFKKYLSHIMPELALVIRNMTGSIAVFALSLMFGHQYMTEIAAFPFHKVALLLAFVFFSRYVTLTFFYESLERLPVTTVSLIHIAAPVSGLMFAAVILGEQLQYYHLLGGAIIIVGLLLEHTTERTWFSMRSFRLFSALSLHPRPREEATQLIMRISKQA